MSKKYVDPVDRKVVVDIDTPEGKAFYEDIESNTGTILDNKETLCNVSFCEICKKPIHTPLTGVPKHICDECANSLHNIVFDTSFKFDTLYLTNDVKYIVYKDKKYSVEELFHE